MAKAKLDTENTQDMTIEQELDSFIESFNTEGVITSTPNLPEGWYPALLTGFTGIYGMTSNGKAAKASPDGKAPYFMFQATTTTDSLTARSIVKKDKDPSIRMDGDTFGFPGNINLSKLGITKDGNGAFWNFMGEMLSQIGLAERFDHDVEKGYIINEAFTKAMYSDTASLYKELHQKVDDGAELSDNKDRNDARCIPAMLACAQLAKITEYIQPVNNDTTLQKIVILSEPKGRKNDPTRLDDHARDFRFWYEIVDTLQEDANGTTFALNVKGNEVVFDLNV